MDESFEFEEESLHRVKRFDATAYDLKLGLAVSASLKPVPGAQILAPEEVQQIVAQAIRDIVNGVVPEQGAH